MTKKRKPVNSKITTICFQVTFTVLNRKHKENIKKPKLGEAELMMKPKLDPSTELTKMNSTDPQHRKCNNLTLVKKNTYTLIFRNYTDTSK